MNRDSEHSPKPLSTPPALVPALTAIIILLHAIYALGLVSDATVQVNGTRYSCLLDDAMISMRYARNFAAGDGLVWNVGERVEGITNPLWTLLMALVHLVTDNRAVTSLYVSTVSAVTISATTVMTVLLAWRVNGCRAAAAIIAGACTAFFFPLNYFSLYGLETGMLTFLVSLALYQWIRALHRSEVSWGAYFIFGVATLVRLDAVIPLLFTCGWTCWKYPSPRRQHLLMLISTLLLFVGGQTALRLAYYGSPLPNTYFLKMTGFPVLFRWARGVIVTLETVRLVTLPALVLLIGMILSRKMWSSAPVTYRTPNLSLMLAIVTGQFAYSIYVGGDAWEDYVVCNRYILVAIPPLFIVMATALVAEANAVFKPHMALARLGVSSAILAFLLISTNFGGNKIYRGEHILQIKHPLLRDENAVSLAVVNRIVPYGKKAVVCCDWAGAVPYFLENPVVDPLGKCDSYIARLSIPQHHWKSAQWYRAFYPGHMKWDAAYTHRERRPDLYVFLWANGIEKYFKPIISEEFRRIAPESSLWISRALAEHAPALQSDISSPK